MQRCSGLVAGLALVPTLLCTACTANLDLAAVLKSAKGDAELIQQARCAARTFLKESDAQHIRHLTRAASNCEVDGT